MKNLQGIYAGKKVELYIPDGLSIWFSLDSGELKTYIARDIFSKIFIAKTPDLGINYLYINYGNSNLFNKSVLDFFTTSNSLVVIDNMELIVRTNPDLVWYVADKGSIVLIGRNVSMAGLEIDKVDTYVYHKIEKDRIWVGTTDDDI